MRIIVCAKQVPDTTEVRIDPVTGTLIREGVPSILNPDDANALEEALKLKDKDPSVIVSVVTMGPPQAEIMLRECFAMGADEVYMILTVLLADRIHGQLQMQLLQLSVRLLIMNLFLRVIKLLMKIGRHTSELQ